MQNNPAHWKKLSLKVALIYAVVGASWIFFSDRLVGMFFRTPETITSLSMIKGWVFISFTALMLYAIVNRGIKKLEESQEALQESQDILSVLLNAIPETVFLTDINKIIITANKTMAQRLGKSLDEVIGAKITDLQPPEVAARRRPFADQVINTGKAVRFEDARDQRTFDNSIHPVFDAKGNLTKLAFFSLDITDRKRAEEELRRGEEKYRLLVNQIPAVVYKGYADGSIDFFDSKVEELTGYRKEDFDARVVKWPSLIVPEDLEEAKNKVREALKTSGSYVREYRIRRKDGAIRWIQGRAKIFLNAAGRIDYFKGVLFDVTEQRQSQQILHQLHQQNQLILDSAAEGILGLDIEGKHVFVNPAAAKMLGREVKDLIGSPSHPAWHHSKPDGTPYPEEDCPIHQTLKDNVAQYAEEVFWRPDGSSFPVEIRSNPLVEEGQVIGTVITFWDITERQRMEKALRDNEQFLTNIFNSLQDGISIIDPDFNVMRVNQTMENLPFIIKPVVGRKCFEVFHGRSEPCEVCPAQQVLQTGQAAEGVVTVPVEDDVSIFVEIHAFPLLDHATGQVRQVVEYARNVTNRMKAEEERLRFTRLESTSILAGGIAHDFNNILTTILGNIGLAALNKKLDKEGLESLRRAEQACFRAQELSGQLLTFAKGGAPIKQVVSLVKLVEESTRLALAGSKSLCELSFPEDLWSVEVDEGQISQVINNLLINADQAMPNGGIIKIEAKNIVFEKRPDLPLSAGKYVKLTITDQGIGIPREYLNKIFDPYFTTKHKGSGLGLATAYSIIKKHSGRIKVDSQLGQGTTFKIYLPAVEKQPSASLEMPLQPLTGQGRILVMDDDDQVREVLCRMLGRLGYEADSASDGAQALEKFVRAQESGRPFEAVILDLTVPGGIGGKETMEQLLKIDPHVKAIVSSGYSDDPIMAEFANYGFSAVIAKPYRVAALSEILQKVITGPGKSGLTIIENPGRRGFRTP